MHIEANKFRKCSYKDKLFFKNSQKKNSGVPMSVPMNDIISKRLTTS